MTDFQTALDSFVAGCNRIVIDHHTAHLNRLTPDTIAVAPGGRKYAKLVNVDSDGNTRSVHCFVDTTNGDVLMAASFKAPAKHARGNIFADDNGLDNMGPYGAGGLGRR